MIHIPIILNSNLLIIPVAPEGPQPKHTLEAGDIQQQCFIVGSGQQPFGSSAEELWSQKSHQSRAWTTVPNGDA